MNQKWLIYCRVSSKQQVKEGSWLLSQESVCRRYASQTLWLEVEKVFNDDGESGAIFDRKSIRKLFDYIDENLFETYVVIFEDLNRFSRDVEVHSKLKREFKKRRVELKCPNFTFEDTPEWGFQENISVAVSQYEREKNRQRVISRQKERLLAWFYCFSVPIGYKYIKSEHWGKIVVKDDNWKIVKSALEKYAHNELESLRDVEKYLSKKNVKTSRTSLGRALTNEFYTGYYRCESMGISKTRGKHQAIISEVIYEAIQDKLNSKAQVLKHSLQANRERKDVSSDFPLRGLLYCESSQKLLSGGWSKGRSKKFPYYTYPRNSPMKGKSINRDEFHNEFETYLESIIPKESVFEAFRKAVKIVSDESENVHNELQESLKKELTQIERKISNYVTRIGDTQSEALIENYEKKLLECESEKKRILRDLEREPKNVWTGILEKSESIRNALQIWKKSRLKNKKTLLKNIFPEWIPVNEKKSVWTATFSLIYQTLSLWERDKNQMVGRPGFEPGT